MPVAVRLTLHSCTVGGSLTRKGTAPQQGTAASVHPRNRTLRGLLVTTSVSFDVDPKKGDSGDENFQDLLAISNKKQKAK